MNIVVCSLLTEPYCTDCINCHIGFSSSPFPRSLCLMDILASAALNHILCLIIRTMSFNSSQNTWLPLDTIDTRCLAFQINFTKNHRKKTGENNMQTLLIACQGDDGMF